MWWKSECRRMRLLIALCVGNDLDEEERGKVSRHVATCPECREKWVRLQAGQQVLEQAGIPPAVEVQESTSVWPQVRQQITSLQSRPASANWRHWVPIGALAAACLGILLSSPALQTNRNGIDFADGNSASGGGSGYPSGLWSGQSMPIGSGLPWNRQRAEMPSVRTIPDVWYAGWQRGEPVRVKPFSSFPPLVPEEGDANPPDKLSE